MYSLKRGFQKQTEIGKPTELWESLKSLSMPNKTEISNFNAIEQDSTLTHDTRSISNIFKHFKLSRVSSY